MLPANRRQCFVNNHDSSVEEDSKAYEFDESLFEISAPKPSEYLIDYSNDARVAELKGGIRRDCVVNYSPAHGNEDAVDVSYELDNALFDVNAPKPSEYVLDEEDYDEDNESVDGQQMLLLGRSVDIMSSSSSSSSDEDK